jgi:hypothetical protein
VERSELGHANPSALRKEGGLRIPPNQQHATTSEEKRARVMEGRVRLVYKLITTKLKGN